MQAACVRVVGVAPKYHLTPVAVGWPSEPLTRSWADRTCVDWSFAAGIFQLMVNVARLPGPYWLFASSASVRGFGGLAAVSLPVKSGPPVRLFCRTEFQHPAPVPGDTPPRTDGSHGPMSVIVVMGGSGGLPNATLSGILMRGEAPLSSTGLPAWKSKSKL